MFELLLTLKNCPVSGLTQAKRRILETGLSQRNDGFGGYIVQKPAS